MMGQPTASAAAMPRARISRGSRSPVPRIVRGDRDAPHVVAALADGARARVHIEIVELGVARVRRRLARQCQVHGELDPQPRHVDDGVAIERPVGRAGVALRHGRRGAAGEQAAIRDPRRAWSRPSPDGRGGRSARAGGCRPGRKLSSSTRAAGRRRRTRTVAAHDAERFGRRQPSRRPDRRVPWPGTRAGRHESQSDGIEVVKNASPLERWRRGWDSNPRDAQHAKPFSRRSPSTTRAPLRWSLTQVHGASGPDSRTTPSAMTLNTNARLGRHGILRAANARWRRRSRAAC